jgi:DNA-binding MarR family transcriptional regulator
MHANVGKRQHAVNSSGAGARRTPAGDAFSVVVVQVLRLSGLLTAAGDELARPSGQTSARWMVLAAVEGKPATVADIARVLGLARQSVQRVADLLAEDGLARYEGNPDHQRAKLLRLTARGQAALRAIQAGQRVWADALGSAVGEAELRRASRSLARILDVVGRDDGERRRV